MGREENAEDEDETVEDVVVVEFRRRSNSHCSKRLEFT